jgi:hypothetical protein
VAVQLREEAASTKEMAVASTKNFPQAAVASRKSSPQKAESPGNPPVLGREAAMMMGATTWMATALWKERGCHCRHAPRGRRR